MKKMLDNFDMNEVIANWFLKPEMVLSFLGIECELKHVDWQHIKEFPFGVLGYDYEEGLRFQTSIDQLKDLVSWIRSFHTEHHIPLLDHEGNTLFLCEFAWPIRESKDLQDDKFIAAGLVKSKKWDTEWQLRGEEHLYKCQRKLSKKYLMSLPKGVYLVSNCYKVLQPGLFAPSFSEYVRPLKERNAQWDRVKAAGADHRLCITYTSMEECRRYLEGVTERLEGRSRFVLYKEV